MVPRGVRLSNPGNIRLTKDHWLGMAQYQPDESFVAFTESKWGYRAMARILLKHYREGIDTIRGLITEWAPPSENNTEAYIEHVAEHCGVADPNASCDVPGLLPKLLEAITLHEQGENPWGMGPIMEGIALEGVHV